MQNELTINGLTEKQAKRILRNDLIVHLNNQYVRENPNLTRWQRASRIAGDLLLEGKYKISVFTIINVLKDNDLYI